MRSQMQKCGTLAAVMLLYFAVGAFAQNNARPDATSKIQIALTSDPASMMVQHAAHLKATDGAKVSGRLLVTAPESSTPVILGADMLGLAMLIFLFRERWGFAHLKGR